MEGFYRNSSEELFLKCLMESSTVASSSVAGFRNLSLAQDFRADSEELFRSWLTNGDQNHVPNSSSIAHRTRQASRKISTEIASLSGQQQGNSLQSKNCNDAGADEVSDEVSGQLSQNSVMATAGKGLHASNLIFAKAWFNGSQPMTRSRSSELRRRYVAMQSAQTPLGLETMIDTSGNNVRKLKQEISLTKIHLNDMSMYEVSNQLGTFTSPSNSSSSPLSNSHIASMDKVSSVVNMLKGTLQRKKLGNHANKEAAADHSSNELSSVQEVIINNHFDGGQEAVMNNSNFIDFSYAQMKEAAGVQNVQSSIENDPEGFVNQFNMFQTSTVSREASQSESSAVLPIASGGFDACDGPSPSGQTFSVCENTRKEIGSTKNSESGIKAKGFREQIIDNLKDDKKQRGGLVRYGSVTSANSVDRADPTKKRRVERSRKMAEAKERSSTPAVPTDMQAVLKRCENLEKEVRSLKLNLSFMNRKDSEQTKQIEELQKQNDELTEEKERLLEEIERILADSVKM